MATKSKPNVIMIEGETKISATVSAIRISAEDADFVTRKKNVTAIIYGDLKTCMASKKGNHVLCFNDKDRQLYEHLSYEIFRMLI